MLSNTPPNPGPTEPTTAQLAAALAESLRLIVAIRDLRHRQAEQDTDLVAAASNVRRLFEAVANAFVERP